MAIVQISRITARKGLQEDLPQPLAGAELGWSIDTRQLYIGNGTTEEGAPALGNTEILTEYSDILSYANQYTYKGEAAGYTVQTGTSLNSPISQSLQSRLDSYCIITDFGAVGDGVTDCTESINRALYQIYCREVNPQVRRGIFFPAGIYKVSGTLLIPPYAMLYGEGSESSVISFEVLPWTSGAFWPYGVLVSNGGQYYRSISGGGAPIGISISDPTYWELQTLPDYIAQTSDSLQQTGSNIGINAAIPPKNIALESIGFATLEVQTGILVDRTNRMTFRDVSVIGPLETTDLYNDTDDIRAVDFNSSPTLVSSQIIFDGCEFSGFTWAMNSQEQLKAIYFNECEFDTLHQGVYLGGLTPVNGGPSGICVSQSYFNNIYNEGIVVDGVSLNNSINNQFDDVGNHFNGLAYPATPVIRFNEDNNASIGDVFKRTALQSTIYPRVDLGNSASYAMINTEKIEFGTYTREVGLTKTLIDNTANQTIFQLDADAVRAVQINYTLVRGTWVRTGVLTLVASTDGTGGDLALNDNGVENNPTGVLFSATESSSTVTLKASTTSAGADAILNYSITHLA